ncbi:MAG: hypothetical protein ACQEVA_02910 [Myxococcota bacterium]
MSNKIDGKSDRSLVDFLKDSISPDEDSATTETTGQTVADDSDDSWLPDLSESGAKFKEMLDDGADSVREGIESAVDDVGTKAREQMQALEDGLDAAEASFDQTVDQLGHAADAAREVFQAKARAQIDELTSLPHDPPAPNPLTEQAAESMSKLVDQADLTFDAYPADDVVELGEKMLDGELSLGGAIRGLAGAHSDTRERLSRDMQAVALELAEEGAQFVSEHKDAVEQVASQGENFWNNPTLAAQATTDPALMATRAISLEALDVIGDLPELSEAFLAKKEQIGNYIDQGSIDHMSAEIAGLADGERFERGAGIGASIGVGLSISASLSSSASVEQTAPDTYQVTLEKADAIGGDLGKRTLGGEGAGSGDLERTVMLEVSGPNAARDAALLVSGTMDTPSRLALLDRPPQIIEGNMELGAQLGADVTNAGGDLDMGEMSGIRREDDQVILEKKLSATLSTGYQTPVYAQHSDALASAVESGRDFDMDTDANPATKAMLERLPDGFIEDIRDAHADTLGTSLGVEAGASAKYSYNTSTEAHAIALQTRGRIHAGETSYEITHDVQINDIEAFERALEDAGAASFDLMERAREGSIPQSALMDVIAQHEDALGAAVDYETKIIAEKQDMNRAVLGDNEVYSGTVKTTTLYQRDDGDIRREFEGLVETAAGARDLADEALDHLRTARRKQ